MVRDNNGVARAWMGECETCMVSALSAMLGLKLNHVTKRGPRKITRLHEYKHLRAHHSGTKSHILSLDAHETAVRYCTILENNLLQSTRGIFRKTFVIITIMLHLTMPGSPQQRGITKMELPEKSSDYNPIEHILEKLGCVVRRSLRQVLLHSLHRSLYRRQIIIHEMCVLDINQTNVNMAMRERHILSNFCSAFIRSCFCPLSGTMQIETIESLLKKVLLSNQLNILHSELGCSL